MDNQIEPRLDWQTKAEPKAFDYVAMPSEIRTLLEATARRVRERHRQQTDAIIETGRDLIAAKAALPHGSFGPWLATEFGWDERTARNYMMVAAEFAAKTEIISDLPATTLYALAAPSVPVDAREAVLTRLQAGEHLRPVEVRRIIDDARGAKKEAERLAKLTPEEKKKAAAAEKARRTRNERSHREWREEQDRRESTEDRAAEEAAQLIYAALGDDTVRLEKLLTSSNVGIHVFCRKLRERIGLPR